MADPPKVSGGQAKEAPPQVHTPQSAKVKLRSEAVSSPAPQFMTGVKLFVPTTGLPFIATRAQAWTRSIGFCGGSVTQDPADPGITHVMVGEGGIPAVPPQLRPAGRPSQTSAAAAAPGPAESAGASRATTGQGSGQQVRQPARDVGPAGRQPGGPPRQREAKRMRRLLYVTHSWAEQCLAKCKRLPEADFAPPDPDAAPGTSAQGAAGGRAGSAAAPGTGGLSGEAEQRRRWLGADLWHDRCATMPQNELMLQAVYSRQRSEAIGNEPLVQALSELARYERALHEEVYTDAQTGLQEVNFRTLRYSKAAAAVRACMYRLQAEVQPGQLPFVGPASAGQINDLLETRACLTLTRFRADAAVTDSRGRPRPDSVGAATRARFCALPGVGVATARRWWELGCRSFEDVLREAEPGGPLAPDGAHPLSAQQCFSLRHWRDLTEPTIQQEVEEMRTAVGSALEAVAGPGWELELVGGGRRSSASHDADFLVTHRGRPVDGVIGPLRDHLVAAGSLSPPEAGFCLLQSGLMPTHLVHIKEKHTATADAVPSKQARDSFDHIYGVFRTAAGKMRRLDIIIAPPEEWPFALVGWTGSAGFLRFMRQHSKDRGLFLNSHRLFQKIGGASYMIPDEHPPVNAAGEEEWPPGWGPGRRVRTERDVFELLGLPYREPHERDAP